MTIFFIKKGHGQGNWSFYKWSKHSKYEFSISHYHLYLIYNIQKLWQMFMCSTKDRQGRRQTSQRLNAIKIQFPGHTNSTISWDYSTPILQSSWLNCIPKYKLGTDVEDIIPPKPGTPIMPWLCSIFQSKVTSFPSTSTLTRIFPLARSSVSMVSREPLTKFGSFVFISWPSTKTLPENK